MAVNCSIAGLYSDIHQQLISQQSSIYQYGIYIGLGSPSQNTSLWPSTTHNETSVRAADFCVASSTIECFGSNDSNVPSAQPPTWQNDSTYTSLDDSSLYTNVSTSHGRDTLEVWTNIFGAAPTSGASLSDFPITLVSNYSSNSDHFLGPGDTLGLGTSSTVLHSLYEHNLISSRSYGLYVGTSTSGVNGLQNGSLVLGGYDSAGFSGAVHTYKQVQPSSANGFSSLKVRVVQVSLDMSAGQSIDLTDQNGFDAYITTTQYPIQLPRAITQKLADSLNASPANNKDDTLQMLGGFDGNLTMTMDDGFKVVFGSSWLSTSLGATPISALPIQNGSLSNSSTDGTVSGTEKTPILGLAFLQATYLFVSHDSSPPTFSLAQANPTSEFFQQEPLCPGATPQSARPPNIPKFVQQGMIGAVLGGVIGGVALILFVLFVIRFTLRRRMISRRATSGDPEAPSKSMAVDDGLSSFRLKSGRSVKFKSVTPRSKSAPRFKTPMDFKSESGSSDSSSLKKDKKRPANVETHDLSSLGFRLSLRSPRWQMRESLNPYRISRDHKMFRSSSIYSGDQ